MIDNHLYKVLKKLIKPESHYYQKIERIDAANLLIESGIDAETVNGSLNLLKKFNYIKATSLYCESFYITPKAHVAIEEAKRTRMMFWIPVIISIVALIFSLLPIKELLQALIGTIPQQ